MEKNKDAKNFLEIIILQYLADTGSKQITTRFPPEPNGYLHIGHAKSIFLNFGLAKKYGGVCNLRFDDTNPEKEETEYVESIKKDIRWLGFEWGDREYFASDYFLPLYELAVKLIKKNLAYVDDLPAEKFNELRGTPTTPGIPSPYRQRSINENLVLFEKMKNGEFQNGEKVLRAKIDLSSPNMHLRDPIMYRIKHQKHHRTGNTWCIYPTYDFAHGQCDAIEKITHSFCTLEFEVHRPLYDWFIQSLDLFPSQQTEFARLNLEYTVVSKRKLRELVEGNYVRGWDDPRMPTLSGVRRRGFTPNGIKKFIETIGVAKRNSLSDLNLLEYCVREDLNKKTRRIFGILHPIKLIITNWDENKTEWMQANNNPEDSSFGTRKIPFTRELFIDKSDFLENPPSPKKWYRLGPDREVRLKFGYIIQCTGYKKNEMGEIVEIYATYDPQTKSGADTSGKKVKGTLSWISEHFAINAEIRLYDTLFHTADMENIDDSFLNHLNPESLEVIKEAKIEKTAEKASIGTQYQIERMGYFRVDEDSTPEALVLNRTTTLRDNWEKIKKKNKNN